MGQAGFAGFQAITTGGDQSSVAQGHAGVIVVVMVSGQSRTGNGGSNRGAYCFQYFTSFHCLFLFSPSANFVRGQALQMSFVAVNRESRPKIHQSPPSVAGSFRLGNLVPHVVLADWLFHWQALHFL